MGRASSVSSMVWKDGVALAVTSATGQIDLPPNMTGLRLVPLLLSNPGGLVLLSYDDSITSLADIVTTNVQQAISHLQPGYELLPEDVEHDGTTIYYIIIDQASLALITPGDNDYLLVAYTT